MSEVIPLLPPYVYINWTGTTLPFHPLSLMCISLLHSETTFGFRRDQLQSDVSANILYKFPKCNIISIEVSFYINFTHFSSQFPDPNNIC
jgi:hypothetical protein